MSSELKIEQFDHIIDNIKSCIILENRNLIAKELVKVFQLGRKDMLNELIGLTPDEMPPLQFTHSVTVNECLEVSNMINQEGFKEGFDMCLEGQMSLYDMLNEEGI